MVSVTESPNIRDAYLRPIKYRNLQSLYATFRDDSGLIGYKVYSNIRLSPIGIVGYGFIHELDNWALDDCNLVTEIVQVKDDEEIRDETIVYGGYMRNQWGHFIVNTMSRLWFIFAHPEFEYDRIVFAIHPEESLNLKGNYGEFFKLLGIEDKIEFIDKPTAYKKVVIPELSWSLQRRYSDEFNLVFDAVIENALKDSIQARKIYPKKCFFTRSKLTKSINTEIGIEFLDDFFARNNFEVIAPEKLTLIETILTIQNADVVAGASGSTVHNILFGRKGQKLIILERNAINNDFQPGINLVRDLDVTYIDSFLTINSVNSGLGPFFYYPTQMFMKFARENEMSLPSDLFFQEKWLKNKLRRYLNVWHRFYQRQWYFQKCQLPEIEAFHEAYTESLQSVGLYLNGISPLYWYDYINPRKIAKKYFAATLVPLIKSLKK